MAYMKDRNERYDLDIIKMIRNNNIPIHEESMEEYNTYFMLDYFDLLFHKTLTGEDKTYMEFWNIRNDRGKSKKKSLNYKAAYRTLSLYAKKGGENTDIFRVRTTTGGDGNKETLSATPFLGIIQINLIYTVYDKEPNVDKTLKECEKKIKEHIDNNGMKESVETRYKMYRSSTSGDFCLIVRSASIENIYRISALINHLLIRYDNESFKFNTYTNVGIECARSKAGEFLSFSDDTIKQNEKSEFALRITSEHGFAKRLIQKIHKTNETNIIVKPMQGLFGRYDFLLQVTMEDFAQIYATLCKSKIVGNKKGTSNATDDEKKSWIQLLNEGVNENKIQIINERVLVPLDDDVFDDESISEYYQKFHKNEEDLKDAVQNNGNELIELMNKFQDLEPIFIEERRVFIDISRELSEVISTYVPQGMENDSHVNWQMLNSDLMIVFSCIEEWKKSYDQLKGASERKKMRVYFLKDVRLITDAINQYYKLLQNVNAQTWQSPVYEIQTQLDAEKMMIAYREFLYEYFFDYKEHYKNEKDKRPIIFPIVYPDMTIDIACAMAAFQNISTLDSRLLICKVPSFEYYGRMFDMLPWILHEASHFIRTQERKDRNDHLIHVVMHNIFNQMLYKFFNKYSNDFGYHNLGALENDILDEIVKAAVNVFKEFCNEKNEKIDDMVINFLVTELLEFLMLIFDKDIYHMEKNEDMLNMKAIQARLLHFLGDLQLLDTKAPVDENTAKSVIDLVESSVQSADALSILLNTIYDTYYKKVKGEEPDKEQWHIVRYDSDKFETALQKEAASLKTDDNIDIQRDYCFTIRELNRLYVSWYKRRKDESEDKWGTKLWNECLPGIRTIIRDDFKQNKGFTELYRILNMMFNSDEDSEHNNVEKIRQDFNTLLQEEVYALVNREVTIYRESYADLYMANALGLNAFGYCRQVSQTTSDAAIENHLKWAEGINVHRFRAVAAVLLVNEGQEIEYIGNTVRIPMADLLDRGEEYCHASLDCAKRFIFKDMENENSGDDVQEQRKAIEFIFDKIKENIEYFFALFNNGESVKYALDDSYLSIYLNLDEIIASTKNIELNERWMRAAATFKTVQKELKACRRIIYRIKCFITLLDLIGKNGEIILSKDEYEHLKKLYDEHSESCSRLKDDDSCNIVSNFFNDPKSADDKIPKIMLEDTIDFIQTYYYSNRFKVMSSPETKSEVATK